MFPNSSSEILIIKLEIIPFVKILLHCEIRSLDGGDCEDYHFIGYDAYRTTRRHVLKYSHLHFLSVRYF
jgi:hypothetical protein